MTEKKIQEEGVLASLWNMNFKNAMIHKAPYTKKWITYQDAYNGDYFKNKNLPDYKSDMVSNFIFSVIETIRPLMLDNNPKFQSMPRQPEAMEFCNDVQEGLMYEWDRESMNVKLYKELINVLVLGTAVFYIPWDAEDKNLKMIPINPFNLFVDPLATSVEDAEYIIYASYKNEVILRRLFPEKADRLKGSSINYSELVQHNDTNSQINNQILTLEIYTKDYESYEEIKGNEKITKNKYPHGRKLILCPEIGVVLFDNKNPYKDGFPFALVKDFDIPGKFWGEGEVAQLLSPQTYINQLNNAIVDNAKATANMPWIIDKNSGIGIGKITARPGIIIRKNPGSEVKREQPPQMPSYVSEAIQIYKEDISEISGIFNTLKGNNETGVYTAQGILALQEAGQVRVRLKVKLLEESLSIVGRKCFLRMKQYWKEDKWLRITRADGSYEFKQFVTKGLEYEYDFKVVAGSTMPVNRSAMLDLMIRLAQTPMPDGSNIVDREAVVYYLPEEVKSALLKRMKKENQNLAQIQQAVEETAKQLQQVGQQSEQNDKQVFDVLDEITNTIDSVNKKILQLQDKYDKMVKSQEEEEKTNKIKDDSYNSGYKDAEKLFKEEEKIDGIVDQKGLEDTEGLEDFENMEDGGLPDDILEGLENLTDEELESLLEQNPNLAELIK